MNSNAGASRAWIVVAIAFCAIIVTLLASITNNQHKTQLGVNRLVLHGSGEGHELMHFLTITHRGGITQINVAGNARASDAKVLIRSILTGEWPSDWKITVWNIAGGGSIKVSTPHLEGETEQQHCDRHDAFVAELQEEFPPV